MCVDVIAYVSKTLRDISFQLVITVINKLSIINRVNLLTLYVVIIFTNTNKKKKKDVHTNWDTGHHPSSVYTCTTHCV